MKINSKIIAIILVLTSFMAGFYYHEYLLEEYHERTSSDENIDFSLIEKTLDYIFINYVNQESIDLEKLTQGAISGMVDAIGDPYTEFFNSEETEALQESITGEFEGIGLQIGIRDNQLTAIAPIKGTPAEKAKIRPKDIIISIDEKSTSELSINEAVNIIRGPKGTSVVLTLTREGIKESFDVEIIRDVIDVPTVEWELIEDNIAHLSIYHFSSSTSQDFKKAAYEIMNSDAKGIILDLRSNPGGLVNQANDIAGWLLDKNEVIMIEKDKNDEETKFKSTGPSSLMQYPIVILINEGTASASEILAGALKDNRDISIIGKKSFGKGTVQKLISMPNSSSLKVTIAEWMTPKGNTINEQGIDPDIEIELTLDDYEQEKDPQLEKAIEEINKIIKI